MMIILSTEFVIYKTDPLIWIQSSQESESLDKDDLVLLEGEAYHKELFSKGEV